jgi:hypothetical protein
MFNISSLSCPAFTLNECSCSDRDMGTYMIQCNSGYSVESCLNLETSKERGMVVTVTGMQFSTRLTTPENPVSHVVSKCEYPVRPAGSSVNAGRTRRGSCCILSLKVGEHS